MEAERTAGSIRWTTEGVGQASAFDYWRDALCQTFVRLDVEPTEVPAGPAMGFRGEIQHRAHGAFDLSRVAAGPQLVRRTPALIDTADEAYVLASIQVAGRGQVRQDDRCAVLTPGDMVFYDSTRPYELRFDRAFEQLVVQVPLSEVVGAQRLRRDELVTAARLRGSDGLAPLIAYFVAMADTGADGLAECGLALLTAAVKTLTQDRIHPDSPETLVRQKALAVIVARFHDSTLDVDAIAHECSVSTRTLQRAFADQFRTPAQILRSKRIDRARQLLISPHHPSVAVVAVKSGFTSERHLYRAFRAATSLSPGEYREAQLASDVSVVSR